MQVYQTDDRKLFQIKKKKKNLHRKKKKKKTFIEKSEPILNKT